VKSTQCRDWLFSGDLGAFKAKYGCWLKSDGRSCDYTERSKCATLFVLRNVMPHQYDSPLQTTPTATNDFTMEVILSDRQCYRPIKHARFVCDGHRQRDRGGTVCAQQRNKEIRSSGSPRWPRSASSIKKTSNWQWKLDTMSLEQITKFRGKILTSLC
jgi:hypothetical protein